MSVAVGTVKVSTLHSAVTSVRVARSATGAVVSITTTVWVWVVMFPSLSSYVQVTTVVPWSVIGSTVVVVPVIDPAQLSVAVGTVKVSTLHPAVTSTSDAKSATGAVASLITTFWVWVLIFPLSSSYVQVTTVVPWSVIGSTLLINL